MKLPLVNKQSVLSAFEAVDDIDDSLEQASSGQMEVSSSSLSLGPLAELLILRRTWLEAGRRLVITGGGDPRHEAIVAVTRNQQATGEVGSKVGAFHIVGSGHKLELASHAFVSSIGGMAQKSGMPPDACRLLKGAVGELIDNVTLHAGENANGLAAYELGVNEISVAVADSGRGVVRGYLETRPEIGELSAANALIWAVKEHRSRLPSRGHGTGFSTVLRAMRSIDAALRVRSDDASIEIEGLGTEAEWLVRDQNAMSGFVVSLCLKWA